MTAANDVVRVEEREDHVRVTLDRPGARNAVNFRVVEGLHSVCERLENDPVPMVITGAGKVFSAGADVGELRERGRIEALRGINSSLFDRVAALPMPTLAVVDGPAIGGGAELAYACDFRIGTDRATFANPEVGLGIIAAAGACWRLIELVGEPLAKEMLLAGRRLAAAEALAAHLLTEVVTADAMEDAVSAWVHRLGRADRLSLQLTKVVLHSPRDAHPIIDNVVQAVLFETEDKHARMSAFLEKERSTTRESR